MLRANPHYMYIYIYVYVYSVLRTVYCINIVAKVKVSSFELVTRAITSCVRFSTKGVEEAERTDAMQMMYGRISLSKPSKNSIGQKL